MIDSKNRAVILGRWLLAMFAFIGTPVQTVGAQTRSTMAAGVDSLFTPYAHGDRPGVAVAVVRSGEIIYSQGFGLADLEHRVPITPRTVFDAGSLAKQFTGLAVATLISQGRLRLTDTVTRYIPELSGIGAPLTIAELVSHTSGLRDWPSTLGLAGWRMDDVITTDNILNMAYRQRSLNARPGTEYSYTNTGYTLLAEVVRRISGRSLAAWADSNIFRPLGMRSTRFRVDVTEVIPDRAFGYVQNRDSSFRLVGNNLAAPGSSSLFTTVDDLARWLTNFETYRAGGREAVTRMLERGRLHDGTQLPYAFGIEHGEYRGLAMLSHDGAWAGFSSAVMYFPAQHVGVVVLANTPVDPLAAAHRVADIFLAGELAPAPSRTAPAGTSAVARAPHVVSPSVLARYAGVYRMTAGYFLRVRSDGSRLMIAGIGEREVPMVPTSDSTFWVDAYRENVAFVHASDRSVQALLMRGTRGARMADRRETDTVSVRQMVGEYYSPELESSYFVEWRDTTLYIRHPRRGGGTLSRVWGDVFRGSFAPFSVVEAVRDSAGQVAALLVTPNERSRNVRLVRRR